uniref:Uncharacterized protein n=1 Tax=Desulfomonile tiedjei TaxID=2358 RepID=A0A7C4EX09_9BACT
MNLWRMLMGLQEKLKTLAERAAEEKVVWSGRKSEWISAVGRLYDDIELWLKPWREQGYLTVARAPIPKSEEPLGDYDIDALEVCAGDETVVFEPFGRNVIGALGRIDVYRRGFKSDAQFLIRLANDEGEVRWELRKSKFSGPGIPFDKNCLERLLDELL